MITTDTIRTRLNYWNTHLPPNGYDQGHYSAGADGNYYRNDCSGYVSMLTGLTGSPNTGMLVTGAYSVPIAKGDLQFGDIIIAVAGAGHSSGHVIMFDHWTDSSRAHYFGHDFGYGDQPHHTTHVYPYEPDGRSFNPRKLLVVSHAEAPIPPTVKPPAPPAGVVYVVKSGDTLSEIAAMYHVGGGFQTLASYNGITNPNNISIGQRIKIPAAGSVVPSPAYTPPPFAYPYRSPDHYGDIKGDNNSHGGINASEKAGVRWIQTRSNELGDGPITVDGIFGPATISAVSKGQRKRHPKTTTLFGQVWGDDWANLTRDR